MKRIAFLTRLILIAFLMLIISPGCVKEYSYEGGVLDSILVTDTNVTGTISTDTSASNPLYSQCSLCEKNPGYALGKWNFTIDTFSFCGDITGQVMLGARTAFTFFGPSAGSVDRNDIAQIQNGKLRYNFNYY